MQQVVPPAHRGHGQKRELRSHAEQIGRIQGQHQNRGRRQGIEADVRSAEPLPSAEQSHEHGRAHRRWFRPADEHIGRGQQGHAGQRSPPRQPTQPQQAEQSGGQNADMQTGDRQQMDRTGLHISVDFIWLNCFSLTKQQSLGDRQLAWGDIAAQFAVAGSTHVVEPAPQRPTAAHGDLAHAVGRFAAHERKQPIGPLVASKVELARVVRRQGACELTRDANLIAGREAQQMAFDEQRGPSTGGSPCVTIAHGRKFDERASAVTARRAAERWRPRRGNESRRGYKASFHAGRLLVDPSEAGDLVGRKEVPPGMVPGRPDRTTA